jgi:uncharacterized OsmC-like protein
MDLGSSLGEGTERAHRVFERRPAAGLVTARATAELTGERAQTIVKMGLHQLAADAPAPLGGDGDGPTPGDLIRGALATCLAMNYAMHAPGFGVHLSGIEVSVDTEIDLRRSVGLDGDQPVGFSAVRFEATLTTDSPEDQVRELAEYAEQLSPTLDDLARGLPTEGTLTMRRPD